MKRHDRSTRRIHRGRTWRAGVALTGVALIAMLGCIPPENSTTNSGPILGGGSNVGGTVYGAPFSFLSGVAEATGTGGYFVTLTDASGYGCATTPSGSYSKIVFQVADTGNVSAANNVTFGQVEGFVENTEVATSGSVSVSELDAVTGTVRGSVNAMGPTSEVSGSFDIQICN